MHNNSSSGSNLTTVPTSSTGCTTSMHRFVAGDLVLDRIHGRHRFRIWHKRHGGELGTNYQATDILSGRIFTLKLIQRGDDVNQDVEREILNHSLLVHPHIVPIKEVFLSPGHLAVVMDHVPECNLPQMLEERRRLGGLKEHQARHIFQQVVAAVDYCHKRGIYNRNIKPANILLRNGLLKLSDFGFSKSRTNSFPKSAVGTAAFMAPETWSGLPHRPYDGVKADVWSCGVLLYLLIFGVHPFEREDDGEGPMAEDKVYMRIMTRDFQTPAQEPAWTCCKDLLHQMLYQDPEDRLTLSAVMAHPWYEKTVEAEAMNAEALLKDPYEQPGRQSRESIESIINMAKQKESEPHSSEEEESVALDSYTLQQLLRRPTESLSSFFPRRAP